MSSPSRRPGSSLRSFTMLWPVLALGIAAVVLVLAPLSDQTRLMGAVLAGLAATVAASMLERAQARRLGELERRARGLLGAGPGLSARALPPDAGGGAGDALVALGRTLDELGSRISSQLKELAKNHRNLEALIDALDEPLLATDDQEQVLLCNRAAEELFDAKPGQLLGRPIVALFSHGEVLAMHDAARHGETRRGRVKLTTTLGARVFQVSAAPVPVAWGEGTFGAVLLLRDVTELDRAVQVKSDFVANASHELRTPVSAIHGAVETLLDGALDDPQMSTRLLTMVKTHSERLEEMIRDLLDLSRLESPDISVEIGAVDLREIEATLRPMFEDICRQRKLELRFQIGPGLGELRTDRRLLLVVLRNLIENAAKFAYENSAITVAARRLGRSTGPREGEVNGAGGAGGGAGVVRLEVTDRGVGIPLHLRERVFERYFQVDAARTGSAARRGTGLGLSIVKHAVKALGGEVGIESVWKEGTTVWIELPTTFDIKARAGVGVGGEPG